MIASSFKTRPEAIVHRYQLKGYDETWQNARVQRVEYPNLPWGKYAFEVLAVDRELFGYERTEETIHQACVDGLSAEGMIDRILEVVAAFSGDAPQGDDMTCVVVRVE